MKNDKTVRRFTSAGGTVIYKLPVEAFPNHVTNCYLVLGDRVTLIDAASGWDDSNRGLLDGFEHIREAYEETVQLGDVDQLILTHGHIDHFGGMNFVLDHADAEVLIHTLDASVITRFDERLIMATKNLQVYLDRAGVDTALVTKLVDMNKWSKGTFHAAQDVTTFEEGPIPGTPFYAHHTPGHCPGQVCLQLENILFTADHVLSHTTPTQSPEFIYRYCGLGHYFDALRKVQRIESLSAGLGGHELEIIDVADRCEQMIAYHQARLDKTLAICDRPKSIAQISLDLFGERKSYHILLAFLETGAHVEYLYERGMLRLANYEEVEHATNPVLHYVRA